MLFTKNLSLFHIIGKHYTTYDKGLAVILYDTTKDPNDVVKSLSYEEHFDSIGVYLKVFFFMTFV